MATVKKTHKRGIYLLPNLFTTAGLFAGFYAIIMAINGEFEAAAIAIFIAMIMDGFDGRIARMTNTQSDFGAEYDSLADMVSFCLAPALVIYQLALSELGNLGWMAAFIYAACGALRLARFNTQIGIADKRYFQGLASPAAAACIAGWVWLQNVNIIDVAWLQAISLILTFLCGLLMVSTLRYYSFKELDLKGKVPFFVVLIAVVVIAVIALDPALILFTIFLLYALSGPVLTLMQLQRRKAKRYSDKGS